MTTPRIEEMVEEFVINHAHKANSMDFFRQALTKARQAGYADGYKQGKFDAEVTAEYGEPEALQDNK